MIATRDASNSDRARLSASSPRRPALHATVTTTVADPRTTRLVVSDVHVMISGARTAPLIIAATETASTTPMTRPEHIAGDDTSERRLGDHLARHEAGSTDERRNQCDGKVARRREASSVAQNSARSRRRCRRLSC